MKQPSEKIRKKIMSNRPDLSIISLETYIISLRMLFKKYSELKNLPEKMSVEQLNTDFLGDFDSITKIINNIEKITTKKNRLTSILVGLDSDKNPNFKLINKYQILLKNLNSDYITFLNKQEKTDTQTKNWIDYEEFIEIINIILSKINEKNILNKKDKLSKSDYRLLQKYVILRLYQEIPVRNDFANMKVLDKTEYDNLTDDERDLNNFLIIDKKFVKFQLNVFKNVHRIGSKTIKVSKTLGKLLRKWLTFNKSGFFLTLNNGIEPISSNGITKLLNSIFKEYANGKKISTSMLRHISITNDLKNDKTILEEKIEQEKIENKYLHSKAINQLYRKI